MVEGFPLRDNFSLVARTSYRLAIILYFASCVVGWCLQKYRCWSWLKVKPLKDCTNNITLCKTCWCPSQDLGIALPHSMKKLRYGLVSFFLT